MSSISTAIAERDTSPAAMVQQYAANFSALLPSHIKPDTWLRLATGALRDPNLAAAAANDPASLMTALMHAARLGLEPGTEQYYLTPRKEKGQLKVLGVTGYQGLVELIYRAGAVSSVIVECVYGGDRFDYAPGKHERPQHEIDWDADDRGPLRLVYAYAIMRDGATSKVVVLNKHDIERIKASSQGSSSEFSPWAKHPAAMWMKSAARQLAKWVPTSAEYLRDQLRAVAEVQAEQVRPLPPVPANVDPTTGVIDGEIVGSLDDSEGWPAVAEPGGGE
jgi:recombination protein RecT